MVSTDKGIQAFRTIYEGMDNRSYSDHVLVELKCLGGIDNGLFDLFCAGLPMRRLHGNNSRGPGNGPERR